MIGTIPFGKKDRAISSQTSILEREKNELSLQKLSKKVFLKTQFLRLHGLNK
jgi:hypothetical protein